MPVLRSTTAYRTRSGKQRRIRLREAWFNMLGRVRGQKHAGNGARPWVGLKVLWPDWHSFRAWAIANGYSRSRCSLDRTKVTEDYGPNNCEWVTVAENTRRMAFYQGRDISAADNDVPF